MLQERRERESEWISEQNRCESKSQSNYEHRPLEHKEDQVPGRVCIERLSIDGSNDCDEHCLDQEGKQNHRDGAHLVDGKAVEHGKEHVFGVVSARNQFLLP